MKRGELQLVNSLVNSDIDDDFVSPDDMMDSGTDFNYMSRKETPAQAALRKAEAGKLATGLAGMTADVTPFVGGAKAATELPDDLSYAKALVEEGYDEADIKKMGLGGAFTALSILGMLPGVKIGTDIAKAGIKKSTKEQMEKLITPKRAEQLEYAKTLPAEERRRYLKEVNRPIPKVFHGARNISKKSDNFSSMMKNVNMMLPPVYRAIVSPELFYIGFFPGLIAMTLGNALAGFAIYKRKTAQLFKELEV